MGTRPSLGDAAKFSDYVTRSNTILITTKLVDMVYLVGFIVFSVGLRHLIRWVRPDQADSMHAIGTEATAYSQVHP